MSVLVPPKKIVQEGLFSISAHRVVNGIEMGVLENGIPYLTESGLARMCGIDRKALNRLAKDWEDEVATPRMQKISESLTTTSYNEKTLYIKSIDANNTEINAYPGPVCLALLEYYAYYAEDIKEQARHAYRTLAAVSFDEFIFQSIGYNPRNATAIAWKQFHARASLIADSVPKGYFSIFREISGLALDLITSGVPVGPSILPDDSVGIIWGSHWDKALNGDALFGQRIKFDHYYPEDFAQSKSNPQRAWAYPESALPEFRKWFREVYLPTKFPGYILRISRKLTIETVKLAIESVTDTKVEIIDRKRLKLTQ